MSDTFPDETLYPVLTSLADEDRLFASNSAAGHESSQIKGSTIKGLINALKGTPPSTLNTLAKLASAINNDPAFHTTLATALGGKVSKWNYQFHSSGGVITGEQWNIHGFPSSGGTLNLPLASTVPDGTQIAAMVVTGAATSVTIIRNAGDQFITPTGLADSYTLMGTGSSIVLVKVQTNAWAALGAQEALINAAIAPLAPLASPALTGTPTAPTAAAGTNTTQLATTAFCAAALAGKANDADVVKLTGNQSIGGTKTFTISPVLPTPTAGDNTTKGATTAFVTGAVAGKANDADVVKLTGNQSIGGTKTFTISPVLPTPTAGDNTTKGATTAFVTGAVAGVTASSIGLGSVDNTADTAKPVSTAQAAAIAACRPKHAYVAITTASTAIAAGRGNTYGANANGCTLNLPSTSTLGYMDGDEICVVVGVTSARELAIVSPSYILRGTGLQPENTPFNVTGFGTFISFVKCSNVWMMSYPDYELTLKAPLASPALTGTPTAPTAAVGTNSTQLATTAFCAAGFLPRFEAVVERTAATTAEPNKLYVNVKDDSAENTLMLTLPSPTGNAGKVIGLTSRYRRSSYTNEEANWKLTGHIDGIASNTYWQGFWELGSALLWCDGTTWHMLTDWRAEQEW